MAIATRAAVTSPAIAGSEAADRVGSGCARARRWGSVAPGRAARAALVLTGCAAWCAGGGTAAAQATDATADVARSGSSAGRAGGPVRLELGGFVGAFLPDQAHEFYDPRVAMQQPLQSAGPEIGLRLGLFPIRFAGVEAELDLMPQQTSSGGRVLLYGARAHLVLELPTRVTPFVLGGFGTMGVRSQDDELATDRDAVGHLGLGLKVRVDSRLSLRLEGRLLRAPRAGTDGGTNHHAVLLGVALAFGSRGPARPALVRARPRPAPIARIAAPPPAPAPVPAPEEHRCPVEAGVAAGPGCPDPDRDRDGVADAIDVCPDRAGSPADQGCPDPQQVVLTASRIEVREPIGFTTNRAILRPRSLPVLDDVAALLRVHPELARIRITGHTDDRGGADHNQMLSRQRAEAVRQYLIARGVAGERLDAVGHGESRPIAPNRRAAGRALNRRVDLEIVGAAPAPASSAGKTP